MVYLFLSYVILLCVVVVCCVFVSDLSDIARR
jgi:hypothetical protein